MKKVYIIVLLVIISVSIHPVVGEHNQSTNNQSIKKSISYRILVDQYHGFYRVYNASSDKAVFYQNDTLNINKGDTITWLNDAVPDTKLTIISRQKLWNNYSGELKWAYKQFSYTFNKSGIYEIYIKERPKFRQKIIVDSPKISSITNIKNNTVKTNTTKSNTNNTKTGQTINIKNNTVKTNATKLNDNKIILNGSSNLTYIDNTNSIGITIVNVSGFDIFSLVTIVLSLIYIFYREKK